MTICACGCGKEITPRPHHKRRPPRFEVGHYKPPNTGAGRRIPPGAVCACGCGASIPEKRANGTIRYVTHDGPYYVLGHNPVGKGGPSHHLWKGGRIYRRGYVMLCLPDDPRADSKGYVPEHRVVWEQANGRSLASNEHVHHISGIRDDNRPENLVALLKHEHAQIHGAQTFNAYFQTHDHKKQSSDAGKKGAVARWETPTE